MSQALQTQRAAAAAATVAGVASGNYTNQSAPSLPRPNEELLEASRNEAPINLEAFCESPNSRESRRHNILYLAYGSNLSVEKFRGSRGIRPLSQINVQVPSLRLTFDLPGIPYKEPCFANSGLRDAEHDVPTQLVAEKKSARPVLMPTSAPDYHKDRWHKGLIGIVYEVTPEDYAHIIATEGGGSSYKDIVVECYPFTADDPNVSVPQIPQTTPFKAHTLFAPALPAGTLTTLCNARFQRPDPSYAQPSARYLKLITDGAAEARLPLEYQDYLHDIRPYRVTTTRQRIGQVLFLAFWGPIVLFVFGLGKLFAGPDGKLPSWMQDLLTSVFKYVWVSYDNGFSAVFGDGERTIGDAATRTSIEIK